MVVNLIAGALMGFVVSIPPMGPISFAIISRGFENEIKEGKAIAFGAAFMDFFYCMLAFGGITLIISLLPSAAADFYAANSHLIEIALTFSGCFVVIMYGIRIMRLKNTYAELETKESATYNSATAKAGKLTEKAAVIARRLKAPEINKSNSMGLFFMGMLLCMSSITLPASWIALIGYLKGFRFFEPSISGGLFFSIGAFTGTFVWFYALLKLITGNKKRITQTSVNKLNIIAGIILISLGVFLFIKAAVSVFSVLRF